jgi:tetratricopeptide (TPR) repeat protein
MMASRAPAFAAAVLVIAAVTVFSGQAPSGNDRESAYRANNVGVAHLEQFDYDGAAQSFRKSLELHPSLHIARLNLGIAFFYGGHPAEAAAEARAAAERLPNLPQAHYVLGLIARGDDNLEAATTAFERVLTIDPTDAGAKVNLGQIALQQRQYDRALPLFRDALAAEPYNVTAAYSIALALTRAGKAEEGRKAMQQFESLRDSAYGVTYAQTYLAQGRYAEAIASTGAEPELVNAAPPDVTFSDATGTMLPAQGTERRIPYGRVTLFDADGDGDLDIFTIGGTGDRFLRNQRGVFSDETERAGLARTSSSTLDSGIGAIAGDYDNDGRADLFLIRAAGHRLFHQKTDGTFEDVTEQSGVRSRPTRLKPDGTSGDAAAFADVDHDGDLDIVVASSPTQLLRNNGNGRFADVAVQAGISAPVDPAGLVATDYDNRRDIDIVIASFRGPLLLYRNMRDGSFRNAAAEAGLPTEGSYSTLAAGDINKDGFPDLFLGRSDEPGLLALSDGQARFRTAAGPDESRGAIAAQFVDYDNDGLLDLLTVASRRARLFRNLGGGAWSDVSGAAGLTTLSTRAAPAEAGRAGDFAALALGDLDSDGDTDAALLVAGGELRIWRNDGGNRNASLRVRLAARVSNRSAVGAKVEVRAGSLRQQLETSSSTPAVAPADAIFGLGSRSTADVVRVLWPSGILQAETGAGSGAIPPGAITITELDRKPSSCPYLFTWNGERFEFVTDFMGGGEMGGWLAPGAWNHPDPDEYVRLAKHQLQPRKGQYELRVTNELEEALFVDRLQLVAVDHPAGIEVFPNEGLKSPPRSAFALTAARNPRPPARAIDEHGHDVTTEVSMLDRKYPDDFGLLPIRGYAAPHYLTLDLGGPGLGARGLGTRGLSRAVLLMTGWTDYAFSNDNVAASQAALAMAPPSLQVKDESGAWRTVIRETGFPVGRPQTVVVPLEGKWLSASRQVRISTNMRIYWDQILVDSSEGAFPARVTRLDPGVADLRWRGFSAETTPDGREPFGYDYSRVSTASRWKVMAGRYTREGDVRPLLRQVDDMFVISRPGDELALAFDERALPALPAQWARTFLVYVHGYSKEMNPRSAEPEMVGPLPFFRMSGYPYGSREHYPRTKAHREYQERYNTRIVTRPIPREPAMSTPNSQLPTPKTSSVGRF